VAVSVRDLVQKLIELWGAGEWKDVSSNDAPHETGLLRLSWEKAANRLAWRPTYTWDEALTDTVGWFKKYYQGDSGVDMYSASVEQIRRYTDRARELRIAWAL
jgi:CDP-glucose 4,6-dehydratase